MSLWSLRCCKRETRSWKQKPVLFRSSEDVFEWSDLIVGIGMLVELVKWVLKKNERVVWTSLVREELMEKKNGRIMFCDKHE